MVYPGVLLFHSTLYSKEIRDSKKQVTSPRGLKISTNSYKFLTKGMPLDFMVPFSANIGHWPPVETYRGPVFEVYPPPWHQEKPIIHPHPLVLHEDGRHGHVRGRGLNPCGSKGSKKKPTGKEGKERKCRALVEIECVLSV